MQTSFDYVCPPIGFNRTQSAAHIGVGTTKFDTMVKDGSMPQPRLIGARKVWDRVAIEAAFRELPINNQLFEEEIPNEWDGVL